MLTWQNYTRLKSCIFLWFPKIILATLARVSLFLEIALKIIWESHSKITSLIPTSQAKVTPSSSSMASASIGPNGLLKFLLRAASTHPSWSRITYKPHPWWLHGTKNCVINIYLYHGSLGGVQCTKSKHSSGGNLKFATWNSFNRHLALWTIAKPCC